MFVVLAARIHKANVSTDSLLSFPMPRVALLSFKAFTETTTITHFRIVYVCDSAYLFSSFVVTNYVICIFFAAMPQSDYIFFIKKTIDSSLHYASLGNK